MDAPADEPQDPSFATLFAAECPLPEVTPDAYLQLLAATVITCWDEGMSFAEIVLHSRDPADPLHEVYDTIFQFFPHRFLDFMFLQVLGVLGCRLLNQPWRGWAAELGAVQEGQRYFQDQPHVFHGILTPLMFYGLCLFQPIFHRLATQYGTQYAPQLLYSVATDAVVVSLPRIYRHVILALPEDVWTTDLS